MFFLKNSFLFILFSTFLFFEVLTITLPQQSWAKTMYIKPVQELAVRRGRGIKYKIIALVETGASVQVLEQTNDYAKIRLQNGKQGWLLKRFLDQNPPPIQQLEATVKENTQLKAQQKEAFKRAAEATASLEETQAQLKSVLAERNTLLENYQQLQRDTANVMQLKKNQEETARLNAELSTQINSIKDENAVLKKEKNLDWFITGAVVLLIGFLLGKIPSLRNRRKRGYLI